MKELTAPFPRLIMRRPYISDGSPSYNESTSASPRLFWITLLHLLGYEVAESIVAKYRVRSRKPPSQTWKSFLQNHARKIAAIDFFTVATMTFSVLYGFVILLHDRRQVVHFNVTAHPTAFWTAQQIIEAFPEDRAPQFLLGDRVQIYGEYSRCRVAGMGIEEVITAAGSPWQNLHDERLIGSFRRECLDHFHLFSICERYSLYKIYSTLDIYR